MASGIVSAAIEAEENDLMDLVIQQPISCIMEEVHFSRDIVITSGTDFAKFSESTSLEQYRSKAEKEAEENLLGEIKTKSHSAVDAIITPAGAMATGKSHFELNTQLDFSMNTKEKEREEIKAKTLSRLKDKYHEVTKTTGSDWKLRVTVKFKNNTPDKTFVINANSYVWAEIDGMKVKVPISEGFSLTPNAAPPSKIFDVPVPDEKIKELLFAYEAFGVLKAKVSLAMDENLSYCESGSNNELRPVNEGYPISIFVDFGSASKEPPVKVRTFNKNGTGVTYGQALRAANQALADTLPNLFVFDDAEGLAKVLDVDFGRPVEDGIVVAHDSGKIRYKLRKEDLDRCPYRSNSNKELRFERISLRDIAVRPKSYDSEIRKICRDTIAEKKKNGGSLSFDEKYCAAMLHYFEGDLRKSYEYFALMSPDDYRAMEADDVDKCIILALAIQEREPCDRQGDLVNLIRHLNITNKDEIAFVELSIRNGDLATYRALIECGFRVLPKTKKTDLGYAAACGKLEIAKWLLEGCPDTERSDVDETFGSRNDVGELGKTPLFWAAQNGHLDMCKLLVSKGADIERKFKETEKKTRAVKECDEYVDSARIHDRRIIDYIVAERECKGRWVRWGKPKVTGEELRRWYNAGVPRDRDFGNDWDFYALAIDAGDADLVFDMVEGGAPWLKATPQRYYDWMLAIDAKHTNLIEVVCKSDDRSATGLLRYALNTADSKDKNKYDICCFLLDRGADVNTKSDENGFTPLMWATKQNDTNMVAQLLQNGADANAVYKNTGKTALCYAIESGYTDVIKVLLPQTTKRDLDIKGILYVKNFYQLVAKHLKDRELLEQIFKDERSHDVDSQGRTPLMLAAYSGNMTAVDFLVSTNKEDIDKHDKPFLWGKGDTALDYAKKHNHQDVIEYLISKGAK